PRHPTRLAGDSPNGRGDVPSHLHELRCVGGGLWPFTHAHRAQARDEPIRLRRDGGRGTARFLPTVYVLPGAALDTRGGLICTSTTRSTSALWTSASGSSAARPSASLPASSRRTSSAR